VDPLAVARLEGIRLAPGHYDDCFDGRIEYRLGKGGGRFYLFYAKEGAQGRPASRVRFSVAHELGHFFLPQHHEYLVSGRWHGSRTEFLSVKRLEREADWFAAALLMPRGAFIDRVQRLPGLGCGLTRLAGLADKIFQTSLTSTAIRYAQLNFAPCCVVLSEGGQVLFSIRSDEMKQYDLGWINQIPPGSVTGALLAAQARYRNTPAAGRVAADVWFPGRAPLPLWEEAKLLGRSGLTLTSLVLSKQEGAGSPRAAG
jgi:hypothetical protein